MKKILLRSLLLLAVLAIIVVALFWGRFSGAAAVYQLLGEVSSQVQNGNDNLNLKLSANWQAADKNDSLKADVFYKKDVRFLATINVDENSYGITSDKSLTRVELPGRGLSIIGQGPDQTNFDLLLLAEEIIKNHSDFKSLLPLNFGKKIAASTWTFFNCRFDKSNDYRIIIAPKKEIGAELELWLEKRPHQEIRLLVHADSLSVQARLNLNSNTNPKAAFSKAETQLSVNRAELNRAIYRGAMRAAGILLENVKKPTVDIREKSWGKGKLININGNRVLLAKGSPEEIGAAEGVLLKDETRKMIDATLYTVGWAYTIETKTWFIDEMRDAYERLAPYIPQKYQTEMVALAKNSGNSLEEVRLTNVFPALFHCSGFALFGDATTNGQLLHGRVLDYMTGIGLQNYAVVYVLHPDGCNAFVNVGFAGFIGSISGMNDKQVVFGEMGGAGGDDWDGMPMAFLMRDGLERATTLEQAVSIFHQTPRTCEYFYVISDGKIPDARGLATTPTTFQIIKPNQFHPLLPHPIKDAVLMSAGDRYEKLAERVKKNFGKIDVDKAIHLMDRPVAMKSNLHDVLFAPQSLELWVANAGAHSPASQEPYTHYSFQGLLERLEGEIK